MRVLLDTQDITDAICLYVSNDRAFGADRVDVDIESNRIGGFAAAVKYPLGSDVLSSEDICEAVRSYLANEFNMNPNMMDVKLDFDTQAGIYSQIDFKP